MHIRIRLLLMQEIERRNQEHIEAYENQRKGLSKKRKKKPMRNNMDKDKKRLE